MIRDDTAIELARAAIERNPLRTRQLLERIAKEQDTNGRSGKLGAKLRHLLRHLQHSGQWQPGTFRGEKLVETLDVQQTLENIVLEPETHEEIEELLEENVRQEELAKAGLEPRHTVLLIGPPGNGKTSVAQAMAKRLGRPLHRIGYGKLIGSLLGETIAHVDQIFELAESHPCVLLMDEVETISAERGSAHDAAEMRRVTATLLIRMEETPWTTMVVGATNHPELLDRAAWRRFEVRLELNAPQPPAAARYMAGALGATIDNNEQVKWSAALAGLSYAELGQLAQRLLRRRVLFPKRGARTQLEELTEGRRRIAGPSAGGET